LAGLPSAGGKAPLWQLAHWLVTGSWVWFHLVGFHPVVAWQLMQLVAATGMCAAGLPVALLPLWQLAQLVAAVKLLWSTLAVFQLLVLLWQFSQTVWPAWMAVLGLLLAWQLAQLSITVTLACSLAGAQAVKPALWQLSQPSEARAVTLV
jgi:hypothetical protein